jgi:glutathione S-transferase
MIATCRDHRRAAIMPRHPEPAMYVLYYAPGTASMVVHLALLEIGAPHELRLVDFDRGDQHAPDYLALNPDGKVPTLLIDGRPHSESVALLMMLAERHPQAGLMPPAGTAAREDWLQWAVYLSNTLMATYRFWFYPQELGAAQHTPEVHAALRSKIEGAWDLLEAHLHQAGPYLLGNEFSGVDLLLTMLMRWSRNMPRPATEWPALKRLGDRVRNRPSWQRLYEREGLREW